MWRKPWSTLWQGCFKTRIFPLEIAPLRRTLPCKRLKFYLNRSLRKRRSLLVCRLCAHLKRLQVKSIPNICHPNQPGYEQYFIYNLLHKYIAANGLSETAESLRYQREWNSPITLGILGEPKSRLVRIKAGTAQENFIRGYTYLFKLNAPPELLRFGYHAGFGEKNSMGFGCVGTY